MKLTNCKHFQKLPKIAKNDAKFMCSVFKLFHISFLIPFHICMEDFSRCYL